MIHAQEVDEREIRWRIGSPTFRVTFTGPPPEGHVMAFRVQADSFDELRDWVSAELSNRSATVGVEVKDGDGLGMIELWATPTQDQQ